MGKKTIEVCDFCDRQIGDGFESRHEINVSVTDNDNPITGANYVICGTCYTPLATALSAFRTEFEFIKSGGLK